MSKSFNAIKSATAIGSALAAGKMASDAIESNKAKLETSLTAIRGGIVELRAFIKSEKSTPAKVLGKGKGVNESNPIRKAIVGAMVSGGLQQKTADNYMSLVYRCVDEGHTFTFDLAKKLAASKKKKESAPQAPAPTGAPTGAPTPSPAPSAGLTTGQMQGIAGESGNNGPAVQRQPSTAWHQMTIAMYGDILGRIVALQSDLKAHGLDSHCAALGEAHKIVLDAQRDIAALFNEVK
jgi:hypothetical protein